MGTRADFYLGRGEGAKWIGSIAWDGHDETILPEFARITTVKAFRKRLADLFTGREDVTLPEMGWPWPWDTSATSDYAYAYDRSEIYVSRFGSEWLSAAEWRKRVRAWTKWDKAKDDSKPEPTIFPDGKGAVFPNMRERQNVTLGPRSGVLIVEVPREGGKP